MAEAPLERINLGEIEDLQTDVLRQLDDLNQRIERTLAEAITTRTSCDVLPESM